MDKADLSALLSAGYSTYRVARLRETSQTNVRYWMKKYGLHVPPRTHRCTMCGETDPTRFYGKKKQICGRCDNQYTVERGRQMAARARAALGGRCLLCGFSTYSVSLDLHHIDASQKDPNFARKRGWSWQRVQKELEKCVLLCKNCHTAVHAGLVTVSMPLPKR